MKQEPEITLERSRLMSRIGRSNTKPERIVRSVLHRLGYRFKLQLKGVPGRPDIAFPGRRKAIQVHGCFWHQHPGCKHARIPATRRDFWAAKFAANRERDARLMGEAQAQGWDLLVLWECSIVDGPELAYELARFLGPTRMDCVDLAQRKLPKPTVPS